MQKDKQPTKVYLSIVKDIKKIIDEDGLKEGDKIPSERELSDRLNVGRSSVREALRALELLGLIETRRGEGTFLCNFKNHQLIQLLGMFILDDPDVQDDLLETKLIIEQNMIRHLCHLSDKTSLRALFEKCKTNENVKFETVMELATNRLLYRIWQIINEYSNEINQPDLLVDRKFLHALIEGNTHDALRQYTDKNNSIWPY